MKVPLSSAPPPVKRPFTTVSGVPVEPYYGPEHIKNLDSGRDLDEPGQFSYTRSIHESMYRGRLWTMRKAQNTMNH